MNEPSTALGALVVHYCEQAAIAWAEERANDAEALSSAAWALVGDGRFIDKRCRDCPGECGGCQQ